MTTTAEILLARLAGRVDGLCWRNWKYPHDGAAVAAAHDAVARGFPPGCRSREDRQALAELVAAGLVSTSGATSGAVARLTVSGALSALTASPADVAEFVRRVARMKTTRTEWGTKVVLGCQIVQEAGPWWGACGTAAGWKRYNDAICDLAPNLIAAWAAGWLWPYFSTGRVWAVALTEAGRGASVPDGCAPLDYSEQAWEVYGDAARQAETARPARPTGGMLHRRLPASRW